MVTKKISLPRTLADDQLELEGRREALSNLLNAIADDVRASLAAAFKAAGGCERCRGRGWIVAWDTLDMMDGSCAEFADCPEPGCTAETRAASGLHPTYNFKYDRIRGVKDPLGSSDAYRCIGGPIVNQLDDLRSAISEIDYHRRNFFKGDRVVVARGRKVPVGTTGRVAWVSSNTGGVLVKDEDKWQDRTQNGVWVNPHNLEKLK